MDIYLTCCSVACALRLRRLLQLLLYHICTAWAGETHCQGGAAALRRAVNVIIMLL